MKNKSANENHDTNTKLNNSNLYSFLKVEGLKNYLIISSCLIWYLYHDIHLLIYFSFL